MVPTTMRAWRVHEYGEPIDVLRLETVDVPKPARVRSSSRAAVPLNLNDYERVNGGKHAVRVHCPTPGHGDDGRRRARGRRSRGLDRQRVACTTASGVGGYAEYVDVSGRAAFEMPESIPMPDAAALFFPFHLAWMGLFDRGG